MSNVSPINEIPEDPLHVFDLRESQVRSYSRAFPSVMARARNSEIFTENGDRLIDFLSGAGSLNYGHNPEPIKTALIDHLTHDGIIHALDMATVAKRDFLEAFWEIILQPRNLNYKVMFPGPTGTNAVEAALKLARKFTGRHNIISFTNGFHGMTMGALAATANSYYRNASGIPLTGVTFMPYDGYLGEGIDTSGFIERFLSDSASGVDHPAAFILETVQAEGGVNLASIEWLQQIEKLCRKHDALLIVDDIQMGCGRTGPFFSFEPAQITPDIVLLSKSLSGVGLPLSAVLLRPELDIWEVGEHNGTFRSNSLALVAAATAIKHFWVKKSFSQDIDRKGAYLAKRIKAIAVNEGRGKLTVRHRGMIIGLACEKGETAGRISKLAFGMGLMIECCGNENQVLKLLPPLTISTHELEKGCDILQEAVATEILPDNN